MKSKALKAIVSIIGLLLVLCVRANSLAAEGLFFDLEWVVHIPPPEVETEHCDICDRLGGTAPR